MLCLGVVHNSGIVLYDYFHEQQFLHYMPADFSGRSTRKQDTYHLKKNKTKKTSSHFKCVGE